MTGSLRPPSVLKILNERTGPIRTTGFSPYEISDEKGFIKRGPLSGTAEVVLLIQIRRAI